MYCTSAGVLLGDVVCSGAAVGDAVVSILSGLCDCTAGGVKPRSRQFRASPTPTSRRLITASVAAERRAARISWAVRLGFLSSAGAGAAAFGSGFGAGFGSSFFAGFFAGSGAGDAFFSGFFAGFFFSLLCPGLFSGAGAGAGSGSGAGAGPGFGPGFISSGSSPQ